MLDELATGSAVGWMLAVAPIGLLVALVLRSRWSTAVNALVAVAVAIAIAVPVFGAGADVLGVAIGKGIWSGLWILYVIWPALLLYHVASAAGLDRMGPVFSNILPRDVENVLIVAWIFPAFIQGVAGFGTPIAVAAPLLVAMGYGPVRAVALPLVGYHWSVTFGSMGSSFYMGALTAGIGGEEVIAYAQDSGVILAVNMALSGVLVCLMHGGRRSLRAGLSLLLVAVPAMAIALLVAVNVEPSIGSLAAATAGLGVVAVRRLIVQRRDRGRRPAAGVPEDLVVHRLVPQAVGGPATGGGGSSSPAAPPDDRHPGPVIVLLPYAYLLVLVLAVFIPTGSRAFVKAHLLLGPSFPRTETANGVANPAVDVYTPIALLGHPGSYILVAALLGVVTYRLAGRWPDRSSGDVLARWWKQSWHSTVSVLALTTLATVMVDAGMVRTVATGAANVTGALFPAVAPLIGALGSFTTGSTTTSNALFSALQRDVAVLIDLRPSVLLAAQTAGGNVGNALAPVVILIGAAAVQARERVGEIFRAVLVPTAVLLTSVTVLTLLSVAVRT